MRCVFGPVKYVLSKRTFVTPSTIEKSLNRDTIIGQDLFTKLTNFRYQCEFRIAYYFMNPETDKAISLNTLIPDLWPVIIGDGKEPRTVQLPRYRYLSAVLPLPFLQEANENRSLLDIYTFFYIVSECCIDRLRPPPKADIK